MDGFFSHIFLIVQLFEITNIFIITVPSTDTVLSKYMLYSKGV